MSTISILFRIMLFKAKPSDVPFSINATILAFTAASVTGIFSLSLNANNPNPLLFTLLQMASMGGMISLFLVLNKKSPRIHQTLLATFGVVALINIIVFTLLLTPFFILIIFINIWKFAIQVYILKNSLNVGKGQAFFMIIAIEMILLFLVNIFFPEFSKEAKQHTEQLLQQLLQQQ